MRSSNTGAKVFLALVCGSLLTACPMDVRVSVRDGSTVEDLVFLVARGRSGEPTELPLFLVESCAATFSEVVDEYWRLEASSAPTRITELTFGSTPVGYVTITAPRSLEGGDGCYSVIYGGADELYLTVDPAGRVSEITQAEASSRTAR